MARAIALFPAAAAGRSRRRECHQYTVLFGSRYSSTLLRSTIVVGITRTGSTVSPFSTETAISTASRTISGLYSAEQMLMSSCSLMILKYSWHPPPPVMTLISVRPASSIA